MQSLYIYVTLSFMDFPFVISNAFRQFSPTIIFSQHHYINFWGFGGKSRGSIEAKICIWVK